MRKMIIYKYIIPLESAQELILPKHSVILSVKEQHNRIVLYALADYNLPNTVVFDIRVCNTGEVIDIEGFVFLGTVKLAGGRLMYHIFYKEMGEIYENN